MHSGDGGPSVVYSNFVICEEDTGECFVRRWFDEVVLLERILFGRVVWDIVVDKDVDNELYMFRSF